jgi:hypothetical protein
MVWRQGLEESLLTADRNEVAPYRIQARALDLVRRAVMARLTLFNQPRDDAAHARIGPDSVIKIANASRSRRPGHKC